MKLHAVHKLTALLLLLVLPGSFAGAAEPLQVILSANGNAIAGDGPGGAIIAFGFDHEVVTDYDPATGLATGRRTHKPVRIVKAVDKSTPLLYKALTQNQVITVEFRFRRPGADGLVATYYTVALANARVSGIRDWKTNTKDLSADRAGDLEEVSFRYQHITWTWVDGGITHEDTWSGVN